MPITTLPDFQLLRFPGKWLSPSPPLNGLTPHNIYYITLKDAYDLMQYIRFSKTLVSLEYMHINGLHGTTK